MEYMAGGSVADLVGHLQKYIIFQCLKKFSPQISNSVLIWNFRIYVPLYWMEQIQLIMLPFFPDKLNLNSKFEWYRLLHVSILSIKILVSFSFHKHYGQASLYKLSYKLKHLYFFYGHSRLSSQGIFWQSIFYLEILKSAVHERGPRIELL